MSESLKIQLLLGGLFSCFGSIIVYMAWEWWSSARKHKRFTNALKDGGKQVSLGEMGDTRVLVLHKDCVLARAEWDRDVLRGERRASDKIILPVWPSFCFYKVQANRENLYSVGSWDDARRIVKDLAIKITGAKSEREFDYFFPYESMYWGYVVEDTKQLFVPFQSKTTMSLTDQEAFYSPETIESARKYLLGL